jgi:hypothetical protein
MNPVVVTKLIDHHRPYKYDLTVSVSIAAAAPAATMTITSVPVSEGHTHDRLTRIRGRPTMSVGAFRGSARYHFDTLPNVHIAAPKTHSQPPAAAVRVFRQWAQSDQESKKQRYRLIHPSVQARSR